MTCYALHLTQTMNKNEYIIFDARIKCPHVMIIAGPPLSGKSTFVYNYILHADKLLDTKFEHIVWFYGEKSETIKRAQKEFDGTVQTVDGLPDDIDKFILDDTDQLFIFDDLQAEIVSNPQITSLFYKKCHHRRVSCILILQNIFAPGRERVNMLRCAHYIVIFQSNLDKSQIYSLAHKILPGQQRLFIKIFEAATSKPNGYLFIDGYQRTPPEARFRTDLFEGHQKVYII